MKPNQALTRRGADGSSRLPWGAGDNGMHAAWLGLAVAVIALLLAPPAALAAKGGLPGIDVRVKLSGTEAFEYDLRSVADDGCAGFQTETIHVSQRSSFESTRVKRASIWRSGSGRAVLGAELAGRVQVDRQAQARREYTYGSCSGTPGLVEQREYGIDTDGCGAQTLKKTLEFFTPRTAQRRIFAIGWELDDDDFERCAPRAESHDVEELFPTVPAKRKLEDLRKGRRKRAAFSLEETYTRSNPDLEPGSGYQTSEDMVVTIRWKAKVARR